LAASIVKVFFGRSRLKSVMLESTRRPHPARARAATATSERVRASEPANIDLHRNTPAGAGEARPAAL
jgi:hypothetical protein